MKNLTDAEIIAAVTALDAEVQTLADNATDTNAQFLYSQAAGYTAKAAILHQETKQWSDLSDSYRYWFNLTQAADKVRGINRPLARRLARLANLINPPASKGDDEQPDFYPGSPA
jgi:hypothetical protein